MNIELHLHTAFGSGCSYIQYDQLFLGAKEMNLGAVCITDHDNYRGYDKAKELGDILEYPIFMGIEISSCEGDLLVYTPEKLNLKILGIKPNPQKVIDMAEAMEGFVAVAHPFRNSAPSLGTYVRELRGLHGVEVLNGNISPVQNKFALKMAKELGLIQIAGSDAHVPEHIGRVYNVFPEVKTQSEFVKALREGKIDICSTCEKTGEKSYD